MFRVLLVVLGTCRLHQNSAQQTNSTAISRRHKIPARLHPARSLLGPTCRPSASRRPRPRRPRRPLRSLLRRIGAAKRYPLPHPDDFRGLPRAPDKILDKNIARTQVVVKIHALGQILTTTGVRATFSSRGLEHHPGEGWGVVINWPPVVGWSRFEAMP